MAKCLISGLIILLFTGASMAVEEPDYSVIEKSGDLELRAYKPMIVAETTVSGSFDQASRAGFRVIANYIFGNNRSGTSGSEKVSMTAPVTASLINNEIPQSEKISMTELATMEGNERQWRIHFVMPEEYTMDSLPTPNNSAVNLRAIPEKKYAVIRFSGFTGPVKIAKKIFELTEWLASKGINPTGNPEISRYNPPWTLPFLRRNEIMMVY